MFKILQDDSSKRYRSRQNVNADTRKYAAIRYMQLSGMQLSGMQLSGMMIKETVN